MRWVLILLLLLAPMYTDALKIYMGSALETQPFIDNTELSPNEATDWSYPAEETEALTDFFIEQSLEEDFAPKYKVIDPSIVEVTVEYSPPDWENEDEKYFDDFDESDGTETIYSTLLVTYKCLKAGDTDITIQGTGLKDGNMTDVSFTIKKTCGSGPRAGFNIGTAMEERDVVEDGNTIEDWTSDGFMELTTEEVHKIFYIWIEGDYGSQEYSSPIVFVKESTILEVTARGEGAFQGILQEDLPLALTLVFECKVRRGSTKVTVAYTLGTFDKVEFSFIKDCGGGVSHGLQIGLTELGTEIIQDGAVASNFLLTSAAPYVVPKTSEKLEFYIRMGEEGDYSEYNTLILSSNPSALMKPYIVPFTMAGVTAVTSEPRKIAIYFDCQKKGDGQVIVTFVMPSSAHVEFSFKKECLKPKPKIDSSVWTANQLLVLTCFSLAALGATIYYFYTKKKIYNNSK